VIFNGQKKISQTMFIAHLVKRYTLLMSALLMLSALQVQANPKQEFSKTINREFSTSANGTTALYNRYGKVTVNTWQENRVKIDITILVNARSQSEAEEVFKRINVNFTNTSGYVKAETILSESNKSNSFWGALTNWEWNDGKPDFKINYQVWMPVPNNLDLKNKYGDATVGTLGGKLYAEIKYGDLRTETLGQDADLYLGYGNARIAKLNNLYGQISYGEVEVGESNEIQADSKYSKFKIEKAAALRVTSKYDEFDLVSVDEIRLQTKYSNLRAEQVSSAILSGQYTDFRIGTLNKILDADLQYGSLKINRLAKGVEVTVVGKYSDVQINADQASAFRFDIEGAYTDVKLPSEANTRRVEQSGSRSVYEGYLGDASAKTMVKARLSYGNFVIR
jgi:Putative adhesin